MVQVLDELYQLGTDNQKCYELKRSIKREKNLISNALLNGRYITLTAQRSKYEFPVLVSEAVFALSVGVATASGFC